MKCDQCHKKVGLLVLPCRECTGKFCTRCIQLEQHACPRLEERAETERKILEKKLVKIKTSGLREG